MAAMCMVEPMSMAAAPAGLTIMSLGHELGGLMCRQTDDFAGLLAESRTRPGTEIMR